VLAAALVIAVASVSSVSFLGDRVARAIARDANQLLGADLVLLSDRPWNDDFSQRMASAGLQRAQGVSFMSMAIAGEKTQLAGVKAVTENYPLRGRLRIAPRQGAQDGPAETGPERGTVWLEERLVSALGAPSRLATSPRQRGVPGRGGAHARA
jgi:putative ABC transport system permease protein